MTEQELEHHLELALGPARTASAEIRWLETHGLFL